MKFTKTDFQLINISNIPSDKEKLLKLISIFENNEFTLKEINVLKLNERLCLSSETFRKMINHSTLIGILDYDDKKYQLSESTKRLLHKDIGLDEYFLKLLKKTEAIHRVTLVTIALLKIFSPSLKLKTFYSIFSLIGIERTDLSAQASVGRNLRAIFSILKMMGIIDKKKDEIVLKDNSKNLVQSYKNIKSLQEKFKDDIVNVNFISQYLSDFFDKKIVENILSCVATYETSNYIWTKSSLYKNKGEIQNLFDEYIMTVILKRSKYQ